MKCKNKCVHIRGCRREYILHTLFMSWVMSVDTWSRDNIYRHTSNPVYCKSAVAKSNQSENLRQHHWRTKRNRQWCWPILRRTIQKKEHERCHHRITQSDQQRWYRQPRLRSHDHSSPTHSSHNNLRHRHGCVRKWTRWYSESQYDSMWQHTYIHTTCMIEINEILCIHVFSMKFENV